MANVDALVSRNDSLVATQSKIVFGNQISSGGDDKTDTLQSIFGLPPDNILAETNRKIADSMPICHFMPGTPDFTRGLDLFTLKSAWTINATNAKASLFSYTGLLAAHGFETPNTLNQGIKVAYLADAFPTDTFTNEYGENFLQGLTDVGSEKAASLAQMMGTRTGTAAAKKLFTPVVKAGGEVVESGVDAVFGGGGKMTTDFIKQMAQGGAEFLTNAINSTSFGARGASLINKLAAGQRIDFPMVWKSSGFQPSYTMTVRLYNPNPRSVKDTRKYIVGPVAALMLLAVPITDDGSTYSWPFFHRIISPGIFDLNPGFISNITVIKGGDQQQISQQQRLGIVDVRIDVGSLFSTMVAGGTAIAQKTRPTVKKYINAMLNPTPARREVYDRQAIRKIDDINETNPFLRQNVISSQREVQAKQPRADQPQTKEDSGETPDDRVSLDARITAARLELQACQGRTSCVTAATAKLNNLLTIANIPAV